MPASGSRFSERLDHLFRNLPSPAGRRYTTGEIARRSSDLGFPISEAYVAQLRAGTKANPSLKHAEGLAAAFGVDIRFFTDDAAWERGKQEIEYLRLKSATDIRGAAYRMIDLSERSLETLIDYIKFLRTQEGLPADPPDLPEGR